MKFLARKKFQLFKRAQMEGRLQQSSRSRPVAKKPKPRDENRFSFDNKKVCARIATIIVMINIIVKVWGKEGNSNSSNTGRHEKQQRGSIMRKQKKKKREEEGEVRHNVNKDDMQLTIENIMLLSGKPVVNVLI